VTFEITPRRNRGRERKGEDNNVGQFHLAGTEEVRSEEMGYRSLREQEEAFAAPIS